METIKDFDPSKIVIPMSLTIIGKSKSGKTEMLHRIVEKIKKQVDIIYLFSQTAKINERDFFYIPKTNLIEELDFDLIGNLFDKQKADGYNRKYPKPGQKNYLLLLDDIIGDRGMRHPMMKNLFTLGTHYGLSIIFLSQVSNGIFNTTMRTNTNWIISFFQHNADRRKMFIKEFCSIRTDKEGEEIYKKLTEEPYQAVVINLLNGTSRNYEDYLLKYKIDMKKKVNKFLIAPKFKEKLFKQPGEFHLTLKQKP